MHELKVGPHNLGVLLPLHHLLEMVDAVHVLLLAGARHQPGSNFVRPLLTIEYMLKHDNERRAFAYPTVWAQTQMAKYCAVRKHTRLGRRPRRSLSASPSLQRQVGRPGWMEPAWHWRT
jgi:hypothetical protein